MKKYTMLLLTVLMLFLTLISYIYQYQGEYTPIASNATIELESSKFGKIKNITWLDNFISGDNALIILSSRFKNGVDYSYLYYLNLDDYEVIQLAEFPSHKILNDIILFDRYSIEIITAYDKGVLCTAFEPYMQEKKSFNSRWLEIEGFDTASSMDFTGNLFYTKADDRLIHTRDYSRGSYFSFFNNNTKQGPTVFYRSAYSIVNANAMDRSLTYTAINRDSLDLYMMAFNGKPISVLPVLKDIISVKAIEDNYGYIGIKTSEDANSLDIFMVRRFIEELEIIDTIPNNRDSYDGLPSLDSTTFNEDYTIAYTAYDKAGRGKLMVKSYRQEPKVIIADENIFGPVKIAEKRINDLRTRLILYYTYSEEGIRIKICDIKGEPVMDLTDLIL